MSGGLIRQLPVRKDDPDLLALLRNDRFHGALPGDPSHTRDGEAWIRADLDPPELRARVGGTVYKIAMTPA